MDFKKTLRGKLHVATLLFCIHFSLCADCVPGTSVFSEQCHSSDETMAANQERTFIMIKPDGVQRGLVGEVIRRFETKGFKLVALKMKQASEDLLKQHYADLSSKAFFPGLVKYMASGPVVPMVWEGLDAVKTGRVMLGATNPKDSAPGTIRGDLFVQVGRNGVHGSDSVESANKEIALWFTKEELTSWKPANREWVYED